MKENDVTTLNAKANTAYNELIAKTECENPGDVWAGFDGDQDAFETGYEAGYEAAPVVDREALTRPDWRQLVWAEMSHRGYTDEEIKAAERQRCADTCEWDGNSLRWECFNEDGKSNHPAADEWAEIAGVIERVLDSDAVLALLNGTAK